MIDEIKDLVDKDIDDVEKEALAELNLIKLIVKIILILTVFSLSLTLVLTIFGG